MEEFSFPVYSLDEQNLIIQYLNAVCSRIDDIIVFLEDNKDVIHRIIDIKRIDGENRYFTKGDYNENKDSGYRTDDLVEGRFLVRIPYVGWPNIWFRRLFN